MKSRRSLRLAAAGTIVLAAAACSSSKSGNGTATTTTTTPSLSKTITTVKNPNVGNPCTFLAASDVRALFGKAPSATHSGAIINGKSCTFSLLDGGETFGLVVSITVGTETYGILKGTNVDHLGDRAMIIPHGLANTTIVMFVRGNRVYTISYSHTSSADPTTDASKQSDQLLAMIRSGAAKLS